MDMNMNNSNFNTQTLLSEINTIINNGVQDIVKDYMKRYALLEETHNVLVNLPIVKQYYNSENSVNNTTSININKTISNTNCDKVSVKIEKDLYVTKSEYMQFMKNMDEKMNLLLKQMSELKNEIDILKFNVDKEIISVNECLDVEKENIKLEIVDIKQENDLEDGLNECKLEEKEIEDADEIEEEEEEEEVVEEEEEETEEAASVETETKKEETEEIEEEEEELIEIEIDDVTYCTNNEDNGTIYELDSEGNVGKKVGYLKDGEAYFDE
jgi:hypothetical protein